MSFEIQKIIVERRKTENEIKLVVHTGVQHSYRTSVPKKNVKNIFSSFTFFEKVRDVTVRVNRRIIGNFHNTQAVSLDVLI